MTPTQRPDANDARVGTLAEVMRAHRFGRGTGGTATGSRCACSCGEENFINSTRDMAERLARHHLAAAILASDAMRAILAEARGDALREAASMAGQMPIGYTRAAEWLRDCADRETRTTEES